MGETSNKSVGLALAASAGLSALFVVVYGGCNWITSLRSDIGTLYFEWERHIPFIPLMIVPYLSIDLFFVTAPFLCASKRELWTFSQRVIAAILIAGCCFLLFPLRYAFDRPHADGWLGAIFDWFRQMDHPYNLLPSLHITLRTFLASTFARHTTGIVRAASNIWFILVAVSTVFTYQHHVLDLVGGFALAGYCFYLFPEAPIKRPAIQNRRIGLYYVAGALIVLALMIMLWPWGAGLLWPLISLCIVAVGYFALGPSIYRKTDGCLPWSTRWALGPFLIGQYFSLLYYRRQCQLWDKVTPAIWIGGTLNDREAAVAVKEGVSAVLDLSAEFSEAKPFREIRYRNMPVLDLTAPTPNQLREMAAFIAEEAGKGIVYVHCKIGYSRSAAAVAAYLIITGQAKGVADAIAMLRKVRPSIIIRAEVVSALQKFQKPQLNQPRRPKE